MAKPVRRILGLILKPLFSAYTLRWLFSRMGGKELIEGGREDVIVIAKAELAKLCVQGAVQARKAVVGLVLGIMALQVLAISGLVVLIGAVKCIADRFCGEVSWPEAICCTSGILVVGASLAALFFLRDGKWLEILQVQKLLDKWEKDFES